MLLFNSPSLGLNSEPDDACKGWRCHMRRERPRQQQKLVIQGVDTVMAPVGDEVVLVVVGELIIENWMQPIAMGVNFLRCGCTVVKIWSAEIDELHRFDPQDRLIEFIEAVRRKLEKLSPDKFLFGTYPAGEGFCVLTLNPDKK